MMNKQHLKPSNRNDKKIPVGSVISKNETQEEVCSLQAPIRKFVACYRKCTRLWRLRSRSSRHSDINLHHTKPITSNLSSRRRHKKRPSMLDFNKGECSRAYGDATASGYDDGGDPFITSPSWLKEEYFEGETRVTETNNP
ncbi:hypothetical protein GQ44DRAFT_64117 [Phaeosphaeriaceae sp. PMI808]|nr:hypothetical protein GQ44DRAFT_64117 [Phaeosphaeriaceae sp. PMI808]